MKKMQTQIAKFSDRTKRFGLRKTGLYFLGLLVLPKLGIDCKYLFRHSRSENAKAPRDSEFSIHPMTSISEFDEADINDLVNFDGTAVLRRMRTDFENNGLCFAARNSSGSLAGLAWVVPSSEFLAKRGLQLNWIRDVATFPTFRGQGLMPLIIASICDSTAIPNSLDFGCSIVVTNHSSLRCFEKAGFKKTGTIIRVGPWQFFRPSKPNEKL